MIVLFLKTIIRQATLLNCKFTYSPTVCSNGKSDNGTRVPLTLHVSGRAEPELDRFVRCGIKTYARIRTNRAQTKQRMRMHKEVTTIAILFVFIIRHIY